ncbi:MAG: DNA alkylation repair protein [Reichenbachiella sp.]
MNPELEDYLEQLAMEFKRSENPDVASQQKAYMRGQFEYFGLKSPDRREVEKPFLIKEYLPSKVLIPELIRALWNKPQRDFQMFGMDLLPKYQKSLAIEDLEMFEFMITHKSWWDTVDFIAVNLVGPYFKKYPKEIEKVIPKWMNDGNMWLQRTCIIFQLKNKSDLDTDLLENIIHRSLGSQEFFINKAIGWVLREYGKTNPDWVVDFVNKNELSGLSQREALRIINK